MFVLNTVLAVTVGFIVIVKCFYKWKYQYWQKRNVPFIPPHFPYGVSTNPLLTKKKGGTLVSQIYKDMRSRGWKHGGFYIFATPVYLITDLDIVKDVFSKNYEYFDERGYYYNEKDDPVSAYILNLGGKKWHTLRKKLNPTFTSSKIKTMFQTLNFCVESLVEGIEKDFNNNGPIDIYKTFAYFTTHVICSCILGLECNMSQEENLLFQNHINKFISWSKLKWIAQILASINVNFAKKFKVTLVPKEVSKFFLNVISNNIKYREDNNYIRNDFLQLLIKLKHNGLLSLTDITAQCFFFFVAGFETTSSTLTFALYEIAKNQDVQDKIRAEVSSVLEKYQDLDYYSVSEMKYLDQVIEGEFQRFNVKQNLVPILETLRKYPPLTYITRKCSKNYTVTGENVVIEKGTFAVVSVLGIHYDEEYYPEPHKFDPERFNKENKNLRHPYTYLAFGEGPRVCIGNKNNL